MAGENGLTLNDVCEAIVDCEHKTAPVELFGIPSVRTSNIKNGVIDFANCNRVSRETYTEWTRRREPQSGDIILAREAPVGEIGFIPEGQRACLGQRTVLLSPNRSKVDPRYLCYRLVTSEMKHEMICRAEGSVVPHLNMSDIRGLKIPPLPPLPEQQAIASILGALDDKIELNRRVNETLESMARAIFKSWFVDFDPVRAKMDGQQPTGMNPETSALFPDSFEEQDGEMVPKGWKVGPILEQADLLSGGTPKTKVGEYWHGVIPWASAKDVSQCGEAFLIQTEKKISQSGLDNSSTKLIDQFATVVVARGATTGRLTMFGDVIAMNQTCYALRSNHNNPFFLYCHARNFIPILVNSAHGSVFDTITTSTFEASSVLLPNPRAAEAFDNIARSKFNKLLKNLHESQTLANLRDTLLPKLLSGELRVPEAEKQVEEVV